LKIQLDLGNVEKLLLFFLIIKQQQQQKSKDKGGNPFGEEMSVSLHCAAAAASPGLVRSVWL
jgi:hypothetical protein